jgi:hypothetical protein
MVAQINMNIERCKMAVCVADIYEDCSTIKFQLNYMILLIINLFKYYALVCYFFKIKMAPLNPTDFQF